MDLEEFAERMGFYGWAILPKVVPFDLIIWMLHDLDVAHMVCRAAQEEAGIAASTAGTVHHLPAIPECPAFLAYLQNNPTHTYLDRYFGARPYRLHSMGGNFNPPGNNYAGKIHRDIRSFQQPCPMINTLIVLDEFLEENGATYLLSGSHNRAERPTDEYFYAHATRAVAPSGSVLMFDSNLFHAGGINATGKPRRSVTPLFCRPWYRPEFDYPRAVGYDANLSPELRQALGYNSRVPVSLEEFYQPPERRMYQAGQG